MNKLLEHSASRRSVLAGFLVAGLGWMSRPFTRSILAQQTVASITAEPVSQAPTAPDDPQWSQTAPSTVTLKPQNLVLPRLREAGASQIGVRAQYDADRLSMLVEWADIHADTDLGTVMQFRDGVAVQFPEDPEAGLPSFTMGQNGKGVVIYHWKSDWQFGRLNDVDEAYPNMYAEIYQLSGVEAGEMPEASDYLNAGHPAFLTAAAAGNALANPLVQESIGPVQKMRAEGFGTLEPDPRQDAEGEGVWREGVWRIVLSVPRRQAKFTFADGDTVNLGFAAWDGSRDERNGQKAYSDWTTMGLGVAVPGAAPAVPPAKEDSGGGGFLLPVFGGIGGLIAAALLAVGIRMRLLRSRQVDEREDER